MSIIYPLFAMVVLTFAVLILMAYKRIQTVKNKQMHPKYFKLMQSDVLPPTHILQLERKFKNLLELPILFYVACAVAISKDLNTPLLVNLAWAYVLLRCVHSFIHIGKNHVTQRFSVFLASCLVLMAMWVYLLLQLG